MLTKGLAITEITATTKNRAEKIKTACWWESRREKWRGRLPGRWLKSVVEKKAPGKRWLKKEKRAAAWPTLLSTQQIICRAGRAGVFRRVLALSVGVRHGR